MFGHLRTFRIGVTLCYPISRLPPTSRPVHHETTAQLLTAMCCQYTADVLMTSPSLIRLLDLCRQSTVPNTHAMPLRQVEHSRGHKAASPVPLPVPVPPTHPPKHLIYIYVLTDVFLNIMTSSLPGLCHDNHRLRRPASHYKGRAVVYGRLRNDCHPNNVFDVGCYWRNPAKLLQVVECGHVCAVWTIVQKQRGRARDFPCTLPMHSNISMP